MPRRDHLLTLRGLVASAIACGAIVALVLYLFVPKQRKPPMDDQPEKLEVAQPSPTKEEVKPSIRALPSKTSLPSPAIVQSDKPILWIHKDYWAGDLQHGLEAVVWGNGRIVWFSDGKPLMGYTPVSNLNQLLTKLHSEGVFGTGKGEYHFAVPDGDIESIVVKLPDRKLILRSCHELFEHNSNLVVLSTGITSLEGQEREKVLAKEPYEYQRFRRIWSEIRSTVKSWIPKEGVIFVGEINIDEDE